MARTKTESPESAKLPREMLHLNGNTLCAIDTETTGLIPGHHDIFQIAVIPLDFMLNPMKGVMPFQMYIKPLRPLNADVKAISMAQADYASICRNALHSDRVADLLDDWAKTRLMLPPNKRIVPLAFNWEFDKAFIREWLGPTMYDSLFHGTYVRDLLRIVNFCNDLAFAKQIPYPFNQLKLSAVCRKLDVEWSAVKNHDAAFDAYATAKCYQKIIKMLSVDFTLKLVDSPSTDGTDLDTSDRLPAHITTAG